MRSNKQANLALFKGKLAKAATGTIGLYIAEAGIGFLTATILARILGPSAYGIYSYSIALAGTLVILALLGHDKLSVRQIAAYCASDNNKKIPDFVAGVYVRVGLLCLVISLVAFLLILYSNDIFESSKSSALMVGIVLIGLTAFMRVHIGLLQGIKQVIYSMIPDKLIRPIVFLMIILLLSAASDLNFSPFLAVLANAVAAFIALLLIINFWKKFKPYQTSLRPSMISLKKGWRSALPFALLAGLSVINTNTDVIMLGIFSTNEDIGIYRIASRVATLISFALVAVNTVIGPRISGLYTQHNFSKLQSMVSKGALVATLVALPCFLLFVLAGDWVLLIFGEKFQVGHSTLSILSIGQFVNAMTGSVGLLLLMTSYANSAAIGLTIGAILNIVLNWFLIPVYGAPGAAVATAITLVLINLTQTYWVWKNLKINPSVFGFLIRAYK